MQNIWLLLRGPYHAFLVQLREELAQAGFPDVYPTHMGSVFAHLPPEGARLSTLAERSGLRKQTIAYFVDYLEARGYVERVPDPTDRRAKLICATERGHEADRVAREAIGRIDDAWKEMLGPDSMALLQDLLRSLNQLLVDAQLRKDDESRLLEDDSVGLFPDVPRMP